MAEKDSTTKRGQEWPTFDEIEKIIANLKAIRMMGDLLCAAMDSVRQERSELHEDTLVEIGAHLEDLATEGLVILRWDEPKTPAEPQVAPEGGAE